jgi:hypothetical protein
LLLEAKATITIMCSPGPLKGERGGGGGEGFYATWGVLCTTQLKPAVIPDLVERSALE